jgi:hypothetical protein
MIFQLTSPLPNLWFSLPSPYGEGKPSEGLPEARRGEVGKSEITFFANTH